MSIFATLCSNESYFDLLERKYSLFRDDFDFAEMTYGLRDTTEMVDVIVQEISRQEYYPSPVRRIAIKREHEKARIAYYTSPKDRLVLGVLQKALRGLALNIETSHVYSNHPTVSSMQGVQLFARYVKEVAKNDKLDLFVIRHDFRNFYNTIPIHSQSLLWKQLRTLWQRDHSLDHVDYVWSLIEASVRPIVELQAGVYVQNCRGIPTGSPMSALLGNLYAQPIDAYLREVEDSFYLRYGDDLIFAHPDPDVVIQAQKNITKLTEELGLETHPEKSKLIYFTRCGRSCWSHPEFIGKNSIHFLGCQVAGSGAIQADKKRIRRILRNIDRRLETTKRAHSHVSASTLTTALMQTLKVILTPHHPLSDTNLLAILHKCSDRSQLKWLDRQILLKVSQKSTGEKGFKALRTLTFRKLLEDTPVILTERLRNQLKAI